MESSQLLRSAGWYQTLTSAPHVENEYRAIVNDATMLACGLIKEGKTLSNIPQSPKRHLAVVEEVTKKEEVTPLADVDNSGTIDYGEFVAATLHLNKIEREYHLFAAFSYFDKDGSGYITPDELQHAYKEFGVEDVRLEDMMQEFDQHNYLMLNWSTVKSASSYCMS
ncbi:calcium-dependent protein kinase 1-like [Humulus lupulus]|uniref:calcium-dependent protein kinase 1-like n=1 Tax=Humulus lupulus TaxID=3486 RepID=UPI002B4052E2|nr:calcium-dependent protein kinase 1-like [Humulus lupulus]